MGAPGRAHSIGSESLLCTRQVFATPRFPEHDVTASTMHGNDYFD